jgi:tRNA 2-thiouridine synthesizing protein B
MLHTVNKSPLASSALQSALRIAARGAPLLLIEDGVYAAKPGARSESILIEGLAAHPIYALEPDLKARGIASVIDGIRVIGYDGFVELVEQHHVVTWV